MLEFHVVIGIVLSSIIAIAGSIALACSKKREYADSIARLQDEVGRLKNATQTGEVRALDGVFEIHITVDPVGNFVRLLNYVRQRKGMKIVFAASHAANNQYMLSHFTRKEDDALAVECANRMAAELGAAGVRVLRVKVEGHNAKGTPFTTADYVAFEKYLNVKYEGKAGKPYFEFHAKVADNVDSEELERCVKQFEGVAVSYNLCGTTKKPLLTIRVYGTGFMNAQQYKDTVMNCMKAQGYKFEDNIQQEFSVYDSNPGLDKGWLW